MTRSKLTTAVGFEIVTGDAEDVSRWTKKGDRLYVNDLAGNYDAGYVDLETGTVEDTGSNVTGTAEVDGDTLTVTYEAKEVGISYSETHTYTVEIDIDWGESEEDDADEEDTEEADVETVPAEDPETLELADELEEGAEVLVNGERKTVSNLARRQIDFVGGGSADYSDVEVIVGEADTEDDPEIMTDGGEDVSQTFDDAEIEAAIESNGTETDVDEVRGVLATVQRSFEAVWAEHMDAVEDNAMELVAMDGDVLVFADHSGQFWSAEFDHGPLGERGLPREMQSTVKQLHHKWARRHTNYDWGVDDPIVVQKPDDFDAGQRLVEAVVINLVDRGLTPRQAWSVWGVLAGNSRNNWARRMGYDSHSGVSNAVREAKEKIPLPYL